jgi:hypothetical protein
MQATFDCIERCPLSEDEINLHNYTHQYWPR